MKIIFAGTPEFAAASLQALISANQKLCAVYTQPDRPAGRGRKLKPSAVKELAVQHNLPVYQPESLKSDEAQQQLTELDADLMIVAAYGLLLPKAVLNIPRLGCINVHASLLPRWRGAAPIQRAILAGDAETGITIMQMDAGLDTGGMLHKISTPISETDTGQTLHDRLAQIGATALLETLQQFETNQVIAEPQNNDLSTYAAKLEKAEAQIDWAQPAINISRLVRAFDPWPVAFTRFNDENLRIWSAKVLDQDGKAEPGTVIAESKQGIDVASGAGVLRIIKLQMPGKRPMDVAEFVNAHQLTGTRFS